MSELIQAAKTMYEAFVSDALFLILFVGLVVAVQCAVKHFGREL